MQTTKTSGHHSRGRVIAISRPSVPHRCTRHVQMASPQTTSTATTSAPGTVLQDFVASNQWAQDILDIQQSVHDQIQQELEPLNAQATKYAPDGVLYVPSLDGSTEFRLKTHRGKAISHKTFSAMAMSKFGVLHSKTGVHACMAQGTPFLDVELVGNSQSVLLAMVLSPRLATLRHTDYTVKYYRSLPPGARQDLMPFADLYKRMLGRAQTHIGVATVATTGPSEDSNGFKPLYNHFHSPQLWTRMMWGHGAMFHFEPRGKALEAVREDVAAMVGVWCAWAKADWADGQGEPLKGALLEECKELTYRMANHLEQDEDTKPAEKLVGPEAAIKLKETVSGVASLAGTPWWAK